MAFRFALPALASLAIASPAFGQDAATVAAHEAGADVTTPLPAERVIPMRRSGETPVFVPSPMVQGTPAAMAPAVPAPTPAPTAPAVLPPMGSTPVYYAYQGGTTQAPYGQTYAAAAPIPAGSQIVTFDRAQWLDACRARLAGYEDDAARAAALTALGGRAVDLAGGASPCEAYLDSYMSSATAGTLATQPQYGQQYMLVPVTVMVPQMPARQRR